MVVPKEHTAEDWYNRAIEFKRAGDNARALEAYKYSIKMNPIIAAPWIGLARVLQSNSQYEDARQCLLQAVKAESKNLTAIQELASAHRRLGFVDDAKAAYQLAIRLAPKADASYFGLGQLYEDLGQPKNAAQAYREVIKLAPVRKDALASVLGLSRDIDITAELTQAESELASLELTNKALIGYGLGKVYQQKKQYQQAFDAYAVANAARKEDSDPFHQDVFDKRIDTMISLFSKEFFQQRQSWGSSSEQPIFIVGLPRSGTTLTEQILASHSQCFGAGELAVLTDLATGTPDRLNDEKTVWPFSAPNLSALHVSALADDYLHQSCDRAFSGASRVVDKQPLNFWHLGLIAIAFPNAKIIHCTRDIRDCGFSIFMQNFNHTQNWSTDLADIAHYWKGYRRLMAHFNAVCGLDIMEVCYEDTVADIDTQAKRILEFVGLPWEEQVLDFHENERAVQTPSRWQVRQPVYTSSVARWQRYGDKLEPLIRAVEDEAKAG